MPLYFAYGANMDRAAMAGRCKATRPIGPARLPRHRFIVTADGYASVMRDARATVHGVLWEASLADMRVLDRFEELHTGLYSKIDQPVIGPAGPRRAIVYIGRSGEIGRPRPGYLEAVLAAGEEWGLPEAYLREIAGFGAAAHAPGHPGRRLAAIRDP